MIRKAEKRDIPSIIELLHQVNMVHHVLRPDLFKPNTTKYDERPNYMKIINLDERGKRTLFTAHFYSPS